ncbi:MAG: beta strand repeat-containing protein, partial [bacterium]
PDQRGVAYVSNGMGAFAYVPETPSTTVTTTSDILDESDNLISLREAIIYASTIGGSNQTITFNSTLTASGNVTIVLNSNTANGYGPLLVNLPATNLTIQGPASGNSITVSGNGATGIFSINSNTTITNLTLTQGNGSGLVAGGAIYSNNLLRLDNITINNSTAADGAGLYQNGGFANLNSSNIGNSVYLSGGANLTASGGQWTGSLTGNNANVINISNLQSNLNIGATVARILTAGVNQTFGCISVTGPVDTTVGSGGVTLTGRNIQVTGNILTAAGDITLYGNGGGVYRSGSFVGVNITGPNVNVTSTGGNIILDGRGGSGGSKGNEGIKMDFALIQTGGNGKINVTGISGTGFDDGKGIHVNSTTVQAANGGVTMNGTGCTTYLNATGVLISVSNITLSDRGNLTLNGNIPQSQYGALGIESYQSTLSTVHGNILLVGNSNGTLSVTKGLYIHTPSGINSYIKSIGNGSVSLTGNALNGTTFACGIINEGVNISTYNGSLILNGTSCGTGSSAKGIILDRLAAIQANGPGSLISLNGFTPANSSGLGLDLVDGKIRSNATPIYLMVNTVNIGNSGSVNATTSGIVTVQTTQSSIDLGGPDSALNLGLSAEEINNITASTLIIGNSTTGPIVNTDPINFPTNLTLISSNSITQTGGNLTVSGTANLVSGGSGTNGNITLNNATNHFNIVQANGTNITIADATATIFSSIMGSLV